MEKLNYNYSFKNIPTPTRASYQLTLTEKIESVIKRMLWKAHFFLNGDKKENGTKISFGFNQDTTHHHVTSSYNTSKKTLLTSSTI